MCFNPLHFLNSLECVVLFPYYPYMLVISVCCVFLSVGF